MKNLAALQILGQTRFDSGALSGLGAVAHQVSAPGMHRLTIFQGDKVLQTMPVLIQPPPITTADAAGAAAPVSVQINLRDLLPELGQVIPRQPQPDLQIPAQGYMVFQAPSGVSGYAVQLRTGDSDTQPPSFDSRELQNGDIFTTTILRPGRYSLVNAVTGAKGEIRVEYPVVGNTPYTPPDALNVQVTDQGFQPNAIQLKPAQGLIFRIGNTHARVQIDLVEPDDGPAGVGIAATSPLRRWENPSAKST